MIDRPTPETDDIARGNHVVPTEWAQQLERERDEAREAFVIATDQMVVAQSKLRETKREAFVIAQQDVITELVLENQKLKRERDEAREAIVGWENKWKCAVDMAAIAEIERDEARRKLNNLDVTAIHSCHNECQRPICVLRRERDEARETLTKILKNE